MLHKAPLWTPQGAELDERYRLANLARMEGNGAGADVRDAWSEAGLAFAVRVEGKRQAPWCREAQPEDSDGLQVWIDTRDVHNVHRAGRFCHRFMFMPTGGGQRLDEPVAVWLPINRAREQPRPIAAGKVQLRSEKRPHGYVLEAFVPADCLTGLVPPRIPSWALLMR